ncbi:hypothetical protein SAMN02745146_0784 [Hymenobacter daecheongensis DSM 21074]|uniref:Right handed beta helix region n=1 Tax=Hymenobacter daecheongensis DSM 21074 TaxID=1121955 RepID=A0A1M6AWA4_9BACT|nr:hypothetical protein [Hymenobacter daecheongensis]SHI40588.1 hypothetical protein SAMN02745146_0784 [Hymenobacter daecheongensis DSM 21074]
MRLLFPLLLVCSCLVTLLPSCEPKENLLTTDASAKLEFSNDTVLFDTVFAQVGTVTKRLWVYNRNRRAVKVEQITLANPGATPYSLIINGDEGPAANNVEIKGQDSLQVLVRAQLGPGQQTADKPFLVEDRLKFRTNGNDQDVKLISYGRNAYFHRNEVLPCLEVWKNDKPHVIFGAVLVRPGCTLTMQAGTRVYAHAGGAIIIKGTLRVNPDFQPTGELKADDRNIVRFAADRLEPFYDEVPGQWAGIQFDSTSRNNVVRFAEIKNASFGLLVYNPGNQQPRPSVRLENTVIKNISGATLSFANGGQAFEGAGIFSFSGDFALTNCLLTNCGEYAIRAIGGGRYDLNFCTIANYTPQFRRETSSLAFTSKAVRPRLANPVQTNISIQNSIVWGSLEDELVFENSGTAYPIFVQNSILRTKAYRATQAVNDNLINVNPKFKRAPDNGFANKFDYSLDTLSPASNRPARGSRLDFDLRNTPRAPAPDLGAYERKNP